MDNLIKILCLSFGIITLLSCPVSGYSDFVYGYENPQKNLLTDWSFEGNLDNWPTSRGQAEISTDAYLGSQSARVYGRANKFGGISQTVTSSGVKGNTMYYGSLFYKSTDDPVSPDIYYMIRLWVAWEDSEGVSGQLHFARFPAIRGSTRWRHIGGDFITPDNPLVNMRFYLEVDNTDIDYLMDAVSLREIEEDPDWQARADANIANHRMGTLTVGATVPSSIPFCQCKIKVRQTKQHFVFGTAIQADRFIENTAFGQAYRNFVFEVFTGIVFTNSMKWRPMEPTEGSIRYARVDTALDYIEAKNMTVRGHSILWSVQDNNPDYIKYITGEDMRAQVTRRVNYVVSHYKGRIYEWDVVNEWQHGRLYDIAIPDVYITRDIHILARQLDPDALLFLNDYQGLRTGDYTTALVDQANELIHQNAPVDGIGIQGHLRVNPIRPEILRKRIQMATNGGYRVSVTELSIHANDVSVRATAMDQALRTFFSQQGVTGITLWTFSDQQRIKFEDDMILYTGADFVPNTAGQVYLDRLAEWRTERQYKMRAKKQFKTIRAFHGQYSVEVYYKQELVKNETIYLNPGDDMIHRISLSRSDFNSVNVDYNKVCQVRENVATLNPTGLGYNRLRQGWKRATVTLGNPVVGVSG